jgi:hypothetical protein
MQTISIRVRIVNINAHAAAPCGCTVIAFECNHGESTHVYVNDVDEVFMPLKTSVNRIRDSESST